MTSPTSDVDPALAELFRSAGVPESFARRTAARLGPDAAERLRADPWALLLVPGVRPEQADHFAAQVLGPGTGPGDPRRGHALVLFLLTEAARRGHTATPAPDVVAALGALEVPDAVRVIGAALDEAEVMAFTEEPEFDEFNEDDELPEPDETLALARFGLAEEAAAEGLVRLAATAERLVPKEAAAGAPDAHLAAFLAGVSVLHGTPGAVEEAVTALAASAAEHELRVAVGTATERAAAGFGPAARGLHHLLEAQDSGAYARNEQRPLEADLVIVPDAMALDVELAASLVEACADGTHLVLCGDPAGMPAAGPGQVLTDLAGSDIAPVIELDAPAGGPVAELCAAVRRGALVRPSAPNKEVVIVPASDDGEAVHRTVQLVTDSIPRALGIPVEDVQVVCPAVTGVAGARALNAALKARLNPGPGAYEGFDPGDRIMVAVALPQAAAGETGVVTGADSAGLEVSFPGGKAVIPAMLVPRVRLGWAVTAQQALGTRWPAVVAVVPGSGGLSRPLVATAFSRARKHLSVVQAAGPALAAAVRDETGAARRTRLEGLLRS